MEKMEGILEATPTIEKTQGEIGNDFVTVKRSMVSLAHGSMEIKMGQK